MKRVAPALTFAATFAAFVAPGVSATPDLSRSSAAIPAVATPFSKIALVECTVIDMMNGQQRKIAIDSTRPELITEGRGGPFAISVSEHNDEFLALTFLTPHGTEFVKGKTYYVGKDGLQVLKDRGVVLHFVTHQ